MERIITALVENCGIISPLLIANLPPSSLDFSPSVSSSHSQRTRVSLIEQKRLLLVAEGGWINNGGRGGGPFLKYANKDTISQEKDEQEPCDGI